MASERILAARADLYARMAQSNLTPLWEVLHALTPQEPATPARPALWRYAEIRRYLDEAGGLITAREAIRRVLVLENPTMPGASCITQSLYAGLQMILPGEIAPPHRHTQSAVRLILEGSGGYTSVDGEKVSMHPGDFIITPSWTWHGHGNPTSEPVVWLDGLDIRIVQLLGAQFCEDGDPGEDRPETWSSARFGHNLLPVDGPLHSLPSSPLFSYPYASSREALFGMAGTGAPDPWHGWRMRYSNPTTGGHVLPTMAAFLQLLPKGFQAGEHRSTDGMVYAVIEGAGTAVIAGQRLDFGPNDVFVVPSWAPLRLEAGDETVLFSFSDRPAQESLGLWRELKT